MTESDVDDEFAEAATIIIASIVATILPCQAKTQ